MIHEIFPLTLICTGTHSSRFCAIMSKATTFVTSCCLPWKNVFFFYQNKGSSESSRVKGWLADIAILCWIPAWGENLCHRKRGFVAHSLTSPTSHRPDMTEICEKVHKTASNQSILPMRQCLFYLLAVLENSVLSMGWDSLHETLKVTSVVFEFFYAP